MFGVQEPVSVPLVRSFCSSDSADKWYLPLSGSFHSASHPLGPSTSLQMVRFHLSWPSLIAGDFRAPPSVSTHPSTVTEGPAAAPVHGRDPQVWSAGQRCGGRCLAPPRRSGPTAAHTLSAQGGACTRPDTDNGNCRPGGQRQGGCAECVQTVGSSCV